MRDSDDNFSFSVNLEESGSIAYMVPSTRRNKDVVMNTQVAARDSFTIKIDQIKPKHKL